jgi:metalloprotease
MDSENNILSRRQIMALVAVAGGISATAPLRAQFNIGKIADAAKDAAKSESITDAELKSYFDQMAADMDRQNKMADAKDPYGKRLAALSKGLENHDGLKLDIKAYLVSDVNAFAMANGTIRVFAGLMDQFTDDEVRYVIGHEIGHVKNGHTKKRMQAALRTSALKNTASAVGGTAGRLADSELGAMFTNVISAKHSQGNEKEADDYAMSFMKGKKYDPMACVTALDKLTAMSGGATKTAWLATHPSPAERSKRMRAQLKA